MADITRTRFIAQAAAAGVGFDTVAYTPPNTWVVTYMPGADQAAGAAFIAAFDASAAADSAWTLLQTRALAKGIIGGQANVPEALRGIVAVLIDELNLLREQTIGVASLVWNPGTVVANAGVLSPNLTVAGAAFGDFVHFAASYSTANFVGNAFVSAANTVNIQLHNATAGSHALASGTWTVVVRRLTVMADRTLAQARTAIAAKIDSGAVDS